MVGNREVCDVGILDGSESGSHRGQSVQNKDQDESRKEQGTGHLLDRRPEGRRPVRRQKERRKRRRRKE